MQLRERVREFGVLRDVFERVDAGAGSTVLVRGGYGAGKTAVLDSARTWVDPAWIVRNVRLHELEEQLPGGVLLQLFDDDELASVAMDDVDVAHVCARALARLARGHRVMLVVDDAHLADELSLRLLVHLTRRLADLPVMLLVAACTTESGAYLEQLATSATVTIDLKPLSLEASADVVSERLGRSVAPELADACLRATGGNPLLVMALADALTIRERRSVATSPADPDQGAVGTAPDGFAALGRAELDTRQAASPDHRAAELLASSDDDLAAAGHLLAQATAKRRRAIETLRIAADHNRRRGAPGSAAPTIRQLVFGGRERERVLELTRLGVGDSESGAIRRCAVLYGADELDEASELAEQRLGRAYQSGSLLSQAIWHHMRGRTRALEARLEDAEEDLRIALASRDSGWTPWIAVNAAALAYVLIERDELGDAASALEATYEGPESPTRIVADAAQGRLLLAAGQPDQALRVLLTAGKRADAELGLTNPALCPWRADAALAYAALGRDNEAVLLAADNLARAEAWGGPRALGDALRIRGLVEATDERFDWLCRAVCVLEATPFRLGLGYALQALGSALRQSGDAGGARDVLRQALDLAERGSSARLSRATLSELRAAGGRPRRHSLHGPGSLTDGEARVAHRAAAGRTNREIADELVVSQRTVAFHLGNTYRKLGISGRDGLRVALAGVPELGDA